MHSPASDRLTFAFIGGTGPEGRGLALRFAGLGHRVLIGSRSRERAEEAARELSALLPQAQVEGLPNVEAASQCDMVFLTLPYAGLKDTLPPLAEPIGDKIVVSTVAPVEFHEGRPVLLRVQAGSAAEEVRDALPAARVASGFQTIDAHQLQDLEHALDTDVLVCSDDVEARRTVMQLAQQLPGVRALSGGRLSASHYVETCTALLITLNRIYKTHSGLRITGVNR